MKQYVSGVIKCGRCGRKYYVHRRVQNGKEYLYLAHRMDDGNHCDQVPKYIDLARNAAELESFYEDSLRDLGFLGKIMLKDKLDRPDGKTLGEEAEAIKSELEELEGKKQKLLDVVEGGAFTLAEVKGRVDKIGRDIEKANAKGAEVARRMRAVYDTHEVTEEEAERRVVEFRAASVEGRHRALLKSIKSCVIEGDEVILIRSDREIFQWKA